MVAENCSIQHASGLASASHIDEPVEGGWVHIPTSGQDVGCACQGVSPDQPDIDDFTAKMDRLGLVHRDDYIHSVHGATHAAVIQHIQDVSPFGRCGLSFLSVMLHL